MIREERSDYRNSENTAGSMRNEFNEQQRFRGWLLIALIAALMLGVGYRIVEQFLLLDASVSGLGLSCLVLIEILLVAALVYLLAQRINVHADSHSIQISKGPLAKERLKIDWREVALCEIVEASMLAQWSGANVSVGHEKFYSTYGRNGLHLVTRSGDNVFIGSRKLDELRHFIPAVLNISIR